MEMEMHQQELHSEQTIMSDSSSANLTSSCGSTTSPSTVPSPSPLPEQQLQAEQNCSVSLDVAPAIPGTGLPPPTYLTREEALRSIRESIPHLRTYAKLLTSESNYQKEASSYKKAVRRQSKDVYLIVSMYALLQGAIFTAVAQSSIFNCEDLWGPVGLVGAVTLGTVISVLDKLRYMGRHGEEVKRFERRQSAVHDKIMLLYWKGSLCEIEALEPSHNAHFKDDAGRMLIFSVRGLLVLGFLVGFSALMIASCMHMLKCPACRCHA